jgi:hypothetical protein
MMTSGMKESPTLGLQTRLSAGRFKGFFPEAVRKKTKAAPYTPPCGILRKESRRWPISSKLPRKATGRESR